MHIKMRVLGVAVALVFVMLQLAQAEWNGPWPDTGQTKCYDNESEVSCPQPGEPFYGQDAQYQGPVRSYTKLGYGGVDLPDSAAHVDDGGNWIMTRDNVSGLIWEIKTSANRDDRYTWYDAKDIFIAGLNSSNFGGFDDWRLPNVKELSSLVNSGAYSPSIDTAWFPFTGYPYYYWGTSAYGEYSESAWIVGFLSGDIGGNDKSLSYYVRAVRTSQ